MFLRSCFLVFLLTSSQLASANISLKRESECLAKIVYAEARGEPTEGQIGVAHTVKRRIEKGLGKSACGLSRGGAYVAKTVPSKARARFVALALAVLGGKIPDNVGGATYFLQKKLRKKPTWYWKGHVTATYGGHEFVRVI